MAEGAFGSVKRTSYRSLGFIEEGIMRQWGTGKTHFTTFRLFSSIKAERPIYPTAEVLALDQRSGRLSATVRYRENRRSLEGR